MRKFLFLFLILSLPILINSSCNYRSFQIRNTSHIALKEIGQIKKYGFSNYSPSDSVFIKGVPDKYKVYFGIVCRNYSELKNENIVLKFKKIKTTMQARPVRIFGKRKYKICINNNENYEGIKFDDIPFNAKIGIIAHEMAHILDYKNKKAKELANTLMKILNKKERIAYERTVDSLTVVKGFGYQLRDWAQFAMYESSAVDEYKQFKKDTYMNPAEIDSMISKINRSNFIINKQED